MGRIALLTLLFSLSALLKKSHSLEYTFTPRCSGQSCSLLSTFRPAFLASRNLTLVFSPGIHRMPVSTMTFQGHQFLELKPSYSNTKTIVLCQPRRSGYNMMLQHPAHVKISGLIFSGCNINFNGVYETDIQNTEFVNQTRDIIRFSNSHNITIKKSTFRQSNISNYYAIIFFRVNNTVIEGTKFVGGSLGAMQFSSGYNITITKSVLQDYIGFSRYKRLVMFSSSAGIIITRTSFMGNRLVTSSCKIVAIYSCRDITIDNVTFSNNLMSSSFNGILEVHSTTAINVTRTNFINNTVYTYAGVISLYNSIGFIGCSNFYNNSASTWGGIIYSYGGRSFLSVTNSIFNNNTGSSPGGIIFLNQGGEALIINSTFKNNNSRNRYRGIITMDNGQPSATIVKSKFIGYGYPILPTSSKDVIVDCSAFINSTYIPIRYIRNHIGYCAKYGTQYSAVCADAECNLSNCQSPTTELSLEQSQYTVDEGIGKLNMGLQVCVAATDLLFGVKLTMEVNNGSAIENVDFSIDCQEFKFVRKPGHQKHCKHIRIHEDSVNEGTEQFSLSLSTINPYVKFNIKKATVFITEAADTSSRPVDMPTATPSYISTTFSPADRQITPIPASRPNTSGPSKTAIVECGPLRRHVNFTSECTDHNNLVAAIAKTFGDLTGLQVDDIAVLQTKSNQQKYYFDVLSPVTAIANYSMVKVVPYDGFSCTPKST